MKHVDKVLEEMIKTVNEWKEEDGSTMTLPCAAHSLETFCDALKQAVKDDMIELYSNPPMVRDALRRSTTRLQGVCDSYPELKEILKEQIQENEVALGYQLKNHDMLSDFSDFFDVWRELEKKANEKGLSPIVEFCGWLARSVNEPDEYVILKRS